VLRNRDAFVAEWAPKIGNAAAEIRWRSSVESLLGYMTNFVWIPLVIMGGKTHTAYLIGVGAAFGAIGLAVIVHSGWLLRHANQHASQVLGFRVGFRAAPPPPRTRDHYDSWCRKHDVVPYSAANR
jgi:hypothetical protein